MRAVSALLPLAVALAAAVLVGPAPSAEAAGTKRHEDKARGFRVALGDKFEQVPPKLTADESYIVGNWYADAAKYDRSFQKPEFKIMWFATPKASTITPTGRESAAPEPEPDSSEMHFGGPRASSTDEVIDQFFGRVGAYFGGEVPAAAELWEGGTKVSTRTPKLSAVWAEVNDPDDKKKSKKKKKRADQDRFPDAYAFVAKLTLDRPGETIDVGFMGICEWDFVKDGKKAFLDIVKSFEDLSKIATDSRNLGAQKELDENDPEAFRAAIKAEKLIKGWVAVDTPHYVVMYPEKEVDSKLAKSIAVQIEALRTQVYEVMFPPDRPIKAISVVRCCKDQEQYFAYGGPPGSAGYWYAPGKELVFYEDTSKKEDSLRVLYHEAFHQYIYYSVGDFDPHSWFNEGTGDYFFGFNFVNGKWQRDVNTWRRDPAARTKREKKFPPLWEWLHWTQREYYGGNKFGIVGTDNYALGCDFVYFLRTTKKKEYQGILDRYFNTLKGFVTRAREAEEAYRRRPEPATPAEPFAPGDGSTPPADGDKPAPPSGGDKPATPGEGEKPAPPADGGKPATPGEGEKPAPPAGGEKPPAEGDGKPPAEGAAPAEPEGGDAGPEPGTREFRELFDRQLWLDRALEEAFRGVDMKKLEEDWLDTDMK